MVGRIWRAFSHALRQSGAWLWSGRWRILLGVLSISVTAVTTRYLMTSALARNVDAFLYTFNFDAERILYMTTLLMLVSACAATAIVFRHRLPTIGGGLIAFYIWYLRPFIERAQHPPIGPDGIKQILIPGALPSMVATLLAGAVVGAAIGAAIGSAYGELAVAPVLALGVRLWAFVRQPSMPQAQSLGRAAPRAFVTMALGVAIAYALIMSANIPSTILTFGIDNTLYRLAPGAHNAGASAQQHGTILQDTYPSPALGNVTRTYFIYLPPTYDIATTQRYPVLYMLHGSPGTPHNWVGAGKGPVTEDALVAVGKMRETIIVSADGTGPIYPFSEWANSFDKRQRMEDAIAVDLVHVIDQRYRTLADAADRAIGGNSEGGYGAVNIALHHPDVFSAAMSEGGYFTADGPIFGYGAGNVAYRAYNSPSAYLLTPSGIHAAHQLQFVICIGTDDGIYFHDGIAFYQQLTQLRANATLLQNSGGHSWELWALELGESMPLLEPAHPQSPAPQPSPSPQPHK